MAFILWYKVKWNLSGPFPFAQPKNTVGKFIVFYYLYTKKLTCKSDNQQLSKIILKATCQVDTNRVHGKIQRSYSAVYSSMAECWGSWPSYALSTEIVYAP